MLGYRDQFPFDFRRKIAQHGFVGGVNAQSGGREEQSRRKRRDFCARKVACAFKCGKRAVAARRGLAIGVEGAYADPVVKGLKGQVKVFIGLKFDYDKAAAAVERQQIEHAAITCRERRHLRVEHVTAEAGEEFVESGTKPGLEPFLRLKAEQRVSGCAIGVATSKQSCAKFAAEGFGFFIQRSFICASAEGDLFLPGK